MSIKNEDQINYLLSKIEASKGRHATEKKK